MGGRLKAAVIICTKIRRKPIRKGHVVKMGKSKWRASSLDIPAAIRLKITKVK